MTDLAQRYGTPSRRNRKPIIVTAVALAVAGIAFLIWAVSYHGSPQVQSKLLRYDVRGENLVLAEVAVLRRSSDVVAACRVRALAEDHSVIGEASFSVSEGAAERALEIEVRTERRATSVELMGCNAPGQPQPR